MVKKYHYFFVVFSLFSCITLQAQRPVLLTDSIDDILLNAENISVLEDSAAKLRINDIVTPQYNTQFEVMPHELMRNKDRESAYWLRILIKDRSSENWVLEFLPPNVQEFTFYMKQNGRFIPVKTGQQFDFWKREYVHKNFLFNLETDNNRIDTFYVRMRSPNQVAFEFKARTHNFFTFYATNEYYFLGMYYGILVIMLIYNLFIFVMGRERVYLYYVFYVMSCMLSSLTEDGMGFQYLWADHPDWNLSIIFYIAPSFFLLSFVIYSASFLELRKNFPLLFKVVVGVTGFYFLYFVVRESVVADKFVLPRIYVVPFLLMYGIAIYTFVKGYKPARYFIVGYSLIFVSIVIIQLRNALLIENNILTVYTFNYGIILEVVILSIALSDRIRIIKEERETAQEQTIRELKKNERLNNVLINQLKENEALQHKVNRELEEKVNERTIALQGKTDELVEANAKLQAMAEELNKMNSQLDMDNWELKKRVEQETKARILKHEISFEQFSKVFPNKEACYQYLEQGKWSDRFICRKCGNDKFVKGPKPYSRKCNKCHYTETITAFTLFHGIKFPLDKAFYIVYATIQKGGKVTLDELSETLDLRKNTCGNFRKKVLERKEEVSLKKGVTVADNWENLIFD